MIAAAALAGALAGSALHRRAPHPPSSERTTGPVHQAHVVGGARGLRGHGGGLRRAIDRGRRRWTVGGGAAVLADITVPSLWPRRTIPAPQLVLVAGWGWPVVPSSLLWPVARWCGRRR